MKSQLRYSVLLPTVLVLGTASISQEQGGIGFTEEKVGETVIRTYSSDIPPEMNPYVVDTGIVYGTNQSADTYLLGRLRSVAVDNDGRIVIL